jgi:DNA-binding MarR family transcriptional regulator
VEDIPSPEAEVLPGVELEDLVGFELRRANSASARTFSEMFSDLELKPGQFSILLTVTRFPDETQASISKRLSLDPSSVVPLVDQLERRNYLTRSAKNRRSHALRITERGLAIVGQAQSRIVAHETMLLKGLTPTQRRTLMNLLRRVRTNLEQPA